MALRWASVNLRTKKKNVYSPESLLVKQAELTELLGLALHHRRPLARLRLRRSAPL